MNYLAKLKDKIGKGQDGKITEAPPFEPFDTTSPRHIPGLNMQPMVVNEPKNALGVLRFKRLKSPPAYGTQTVAVSDQTVAVSDLNAALEVFRKTRPHGTTRLRHEQACWAVEMFLNEWASVAAEFGWTAADIFDSPCDDSGALAYWLGTDIVTALGPDHAVTETNRVFERN